MYAKFDTLSKPKPKSWCLGFASVVWPSCRLQSSAFQPSGRQSSVSSLRSAALSPLSTVPSLQTRDTKKARAISATKQANNARPTACSSRPFPTLERRQLLPLSPSHALRSTVEHQHQHIWLGIDASLCDPWTVPALSCTVDDSARGTEQLRCGEAV